MSRLLGEVQFQAACLEYAQFHWAETPQAAVRELSVLTVSFLVRLASHGQADQIEKLLGDHQMDSYWALYRRVDLNTGKKKMGQTLSTPKTFFGYVAGSKNREPLGVIDSIVKRHQELTTGRHELLTTL